MKITIQYKTDPNSPEGLSDCCAYTFLKGEYLCGWGNNFDDAESALLTKLRDASKRASAPEPKEVEI